MSENERESLASTKLPRLFAQKIRVDRGGKCIVRDVDVSAEASPHHLLLTDEDVRSLDPNAFNLRSVPDRVRALKADPWAGIAEIRQSLPTL